MKYPHPIQAGNWKYFAKKTTRKSRAGMALVLVLCAVALISVLALSIFSPVGNERVFSNVYAKGVQTNLLADSAVNLVIGQIRDATADGSLNWASQPGGIRTYDTGGAFVNGYKLYSSSSMVVSGTEATFANDDYGNLSDWEKKPGQYVDLNEPGYTYDNGAAIAHYPILNPALLGENIAGFMLASSSNGTTVPSELGASSGASSTVKMPVEWLYVLRDGTLTAGTYQNGKIVFDKNPPSATNPIQGRIAFWADDETSKVNINTASEGLFWDTPRANSFKKSNDTASDYTNPNSGSVYNYSIVSGSNPATDYERGLAFIQPANGEYNRYPGHPAMNCLSVLLPDSADDIAQGKPLSTGTIQKILAFAPVLQNQSGTLQGSQMGGYRVSSANPSGSAVTRDGSPLHTTVDDAAMVSSTTSSTPRTGTELFTPAQMEQRGFLMTTTSRAPELNLFNRPRIAMWPVNNEARYRTAYDNLVALCSTITNRTSTKSWPFLFKRTGAGENSGAYNPAAEWNVTSNRDLYNYLTNSTTGLMYKNIPGFGRSFSSKYNNNTPGYSCSQIAIELLDYIRCINIFDATLEDKDGSYTTDSSAVVTGDNGEYTIGLAKTNQGGAIASSNGLKLGLPGHGMVLPLSSPDGKGYRGLGRVPTISEVAVHVICTGEYNAETTDFDKTKKLMNLNKTLPADLTAGQKCFQAMIHLSLYNPMPGPPNLVPRIYTEVTGLSNVKIGGKNVFPGDTGIASTPRNSVNPTTKPPTLHGAGTWYGIDGAANMGFLPFVALATAPARGVLGADPAEAIDSADSNTNTTENSLMSAPFIAGSLEQPLDKMTVEGTITIKLHYGDDARGPVYQTLAVDLGKVTQKAVYPELPIGARGQITPQALWSFSRSGIGPSATINEDNKGKTSFTGTLGRLAVINHNSTVSPVFYPRPDLYLIPYANEKKDRLDTIVSVHAKSGDYRLSALALSGTIREASQFALDSDASRGSDRLAHTLMMDSNFQAKKTTSSDPWNLDTSDGSHYNITFNNGNPEPGGDNTLGANATFVDARNAPYLFGSLAGSSVTYNPRALPNVPYSVNGAYQPANNWWGDWDNGLASELDGPFGNMPDVGNVHQQTNFTANASYFNQPSCDVGINALFFSPNRQVPSSGMFGSLPVGGNAWRTLLFRPEGTTPGTPGTTPGTPGSTAGSAHPGAANPPDHLVMDWFWMPVVSPYVISDPFSTAGKINMNYQILPFHHIVRQTGLYSLLKAEKIMAIPNEDSQIYKVGGSTTAYRHSIDIGKTLQQFDDNYFSKGKIFKSATEICDQYLVPVGMGVSDYTAMNGFWKKYRLTGDNSKERPYTNIYPRLTTRSNTFRVHYRVQMLQKVPGTAANVFVDPNGSAFGAKDQVMSESRGSCVVERYLEHDDPRFGNTIDPMTDTLNKAYKFRIVGVESFDR